MRQMGELQKGVTGKGTCYPLMKKQFHIPQSGAGHGSSRTASWRTTKAKLGSGSVHLLFCTKRSTRLLRAAGEEAAQLVVSPSWAGYKSEGGAFWHLPFPSMSWDSVSISSTAQQGGSTGHSDAGAKWALLPPLGHGEGSAGGTSSSCIQTKPLAVFLALSFQALGRQKRLRWLLCLSGFGEWQTAAVVHREAPGKSLCSAWPFCFRVPFTSPLLNISHRPFQLLSSSLYFALILWPPFLSFFLLNIVW